MRKGFTLVEMLVVITVLLILLGMAIPAVVRAKIAANDTSAKTILRTVSNAAEWYSNVNAAYPTSEAQLVGASPAYLNKSYCAQTLTGYDVTCTFTSGSYTLTAVPVTVGSTGTTTYTITTGGVLTP